MINIIEWLSGLLFFMAIILGFFSTVAFSATNSKQRRLLIPWIALAAGVSYFLVSTAYFSLPEVSVTVPIRIDIPIIIPFMLYALYVGFSSLNKFTPKDPEKSENKET